jgi:hypothetical protein
MGGTGSEGDRTDGAGGSGNASGMGSDGEGTDAGPWGNGDKGGDAIPPVGPGGKGGDGISVAWAIAGPTQAIKAPTKTAPSSFPRITCRPHMLTTED